MAHICPLRVVVRQFTLQRNGSHEILRYQRSLFSDAASIYIVTYVCT